MEHPVGGAFANSEENLLYKVRVLEKVSYQAYQALIATEEALEVSLSAIEDLSAKVEFRESDVDFFRQEAMEKDAENLHLKERIKRMKGGERER